MFSGSFPEEIHNKKKTTLTAQVAEQKLSEKQLPKCPQKPARMPVFAIP
jgi:hypothetical protein